MAQIVTTMTRDHTKSIGDLLLPIATSSVHLAREYVNLLCDAWSVPGTDNAELCVSELAGNVTRHASGSGSDMRIVAVLRGERLRVEVHDSSTAIPELRQTPLDCESGNGLFLVDAVSADWGYYRTENGKAVWFELSRWGSND
jgi:anti-sigma regulatory factor (Ser/Thr protein kinase)